MNIPVTRTKYVLPRRRADLLTRQRLLDLLQNLLDEKLIILAAPAGYGKTSLLIDLAYHSELPVCWYSLDPLDRDLKRFAAYFIACISQRYPAFGSQSNLALQSLSTSSPDIDRLVTSIVNESYETIQEHFLIILDDFHFVNDQDEINQFVGRFIQDVDENCHMVLSSRTLLTLPDLPLMVARSQVGGLGFDELAFQADEIQKLIEQNYHISIPASIASDLATESEGWITGLLLSTQTMWQGMTDRLRTARVSAVGLYDYLAQQVLDQQTPAVKNFLLRSSAIEEFDAELLENVLGPAPDPGETWQSLMETVLRNNLFVLPVGEKGLWLRYHHLFRDFLQARFAQEYPSEEREIVKALGKYFSVRGEWDKSFAYYQRLGDTEDTIDLIEQAGSGMIKNGRFTTLASWIDSLPSDRMYSHPVLLSLRGAVDMMQGKTEQSLALLTQSVEIFRRSGEIQQLAQALPRRAYAYQYLGKYQQALADAEEAIRLTADNEHLLFPRAEALRIRGFCYYRLGRWEEAVYHLKEAAFVYNTLGNSVSQALVMIDLGGVLHVMGSFSQSKFAYENALSYLEKIKDLGRQATVINNLGVLYMAMGEYEQAAVSLDKALILARQSGYILMEAVSLASIGDLYHELDALDAASKAYRSSSEIAERINDRFLLFYLPLANLDGVIKHGGTEKARNLLDVARRIAIEDESDYEQAMAEFENGRYELIIGHPEQAISSLTRAISSFALGSQHIEATRAHLYLGCAHFAAGDCETACTEVQKALQLASHFESSHILIPAARQLKDTLVQLQPDPRLTEPVGELLIQVDGFDREIPSLRRRLRKKTRSVPFGLPRLVISTLGKSQVLLDGKPVKDLGSQSQKARDLFFLLLRTPEGLPKEAIGNMLWPESTPPQLKLQFKNAIYRLRRSLEQDVILLQGDDYTFNHSLDYEYDVEVFDAKLLQAHDEPDPAQKICLLQDGIKLYNGIFLPELEGEWVNAERARVSHAYHNAVLNLSELLLAAGQYKSALDHCQSLLAGDPCLEEAHRLVMRIHAAQGNKAAVVRQFERCQQNLIKEVNLSPSIQTVQLFESLTQ
jgi:LuxR family transcriptional regulator, maltose regulon positive regulatory protein